MRRIIPLILFLTLILPGTMPGADAQTTGITNIEIILDCSETMKREVNQAGKLTTAKTALFEFINDAPSKYRYALRIMGGGENATHYSSELIAGLGLLSKYSLNEKIRELKAGGERALYHALSDCLYDFNDMDANNIVMLITDGLDDGERSLEDLEFYYEFTPGAPKLYIFGLDLTSSMEEEFNNLTKVAGGRVFNISDPAQLADILIDSVSEFSGNLSVYVFDHNGNPVNGDIQVFDISGNPVTAVFDSSVLIAEVPAGIYTVEVKYKGETKRSDPMDIGRDKSGKINFVYKMLAGNVRVTLLDSLYDSIKGSIVVRNMSYQIVYEGGPDNYFSISLPEGAYDFEATSGGRSYQQNGVVVSHDSRIDIEIVIPIVQSVLEVEVNNLESIPVNAKIRVYTSDGYVMGNAEYASYFHITLPPDSYTVEVEVAGQRYEQTISLIEGDQVTLSFDVAVRVGYLLVELRTDSGYDAWGTVRVFDENGRYMRHWSHESDESPDWAFELPEGRYKVEAEVDNIVSSRDSVYVSADEDMIVVIRFPDYVR